MAIFGLPVFDRSFTQILARRSIALILSLSATTIYAEISATGIESHPAMKESFMPVDDTANPQTDTWQLDAEQWEFARSGEAILSLPVLKSLMKTWLSEKNKMIEIQYPGGEDGEFWMQELTDWLVALGISSNYMITIPGSGADDMIKFNLIKYKTSGRMIGE